MKFRTLLLFAFSLFYLSPRSAITANACLSLRLVPEAASPAAAPSPFPEMDQPSPVAVKIELLKKAAQTAHATATIQTQKLKRIQEKVLDISTEITLKESEFARLAQRIQACHIQGQALVASTSPRSAKIKRDLEKLVHHLGVMQVQQERLYSHILRLKRAEAHGNVIEEKKHIKTTKAFDEARILEEITQILMFTQTKLSAAYLEASNQFSFGYQLQHLQRESTILADSNLKEAVLAYIPSAAICPLEEIELCYKIAQQASISLEQLTPSRDEACKLWTLKILHLFANHTAHLLVESDYPSI